MEKQGRRAHRRLARGGSPVLQLRALLMIVELDVMEQGDLAGADASLFLSSRSGYTNDDWTMIRSCYTFRVRVNERTTRIDLRVYCTPVNGNSIALPGYVMEHCVEFYGLARSQVER